MADGIKIGGLEVFADYSSNGLRFTFRAGGLQSLATFRGADDVVPEASGRYPGEFIADIREVTLHGLVVGIGADEQAIRESFAANFGALLNVMVPGDLISIVVYPPHFGLAVAETATLLDCRPMRIVGPDPAEVEWYRSWEGDLQLTCIGSPPDWVVEELS